MFRQLKFDVEVFISGGILVMVFLPGWCEFCSYLFKDFHVAVVSHTDDVLTLL